MKKRIMNKSTLKSCKKYLKSFLQNKKIIKQKRANEKRGKKSRTARLTGFGQSRAGILMHHPISRLPLPPLQRPLLPQLEPRIPPGRSCKISQMQKKFFISLGCYLIVL